ncbi:MAG: M48 family metalloprotease [Chloroflexota bacterium]|nr:M48 family metalloprotease [Chloroflexota bacterium]
MVLRPVFRTTLLLGALTGLLLAFGYVVAGPEGVLPALLLAALLNLAAYWFSDRAALAMAGAREVSYAEAPVLHRIVANLAARAELPMPRVAIVEAAAPNAFATGRDPHHAVVAVTTRLLEILDEDELVAVLAHELGHVRNRDILISSVAATLAGAVTALADWLQWGLFFGAHQDDDDPSPLHWLGALMMLVLAPIAAMLIQLAISRGREFGADETGAELIGDPLALARALEKIEEYAAGTPLHVNPAVSHLFIIPPLTGEALVLLR